MTEKKSPNHNNDENERNSSEAPNRFFMTIEELQRWTITREEAEKRTKKIREERDAYHEQRMKEPKEVTRLWMELIAVLATATSSEEEEEAKQRKIEQLAALMAAASSKASDEADGKTKLKSDDQNKGLSKEEE